MTPRQYAAIAVIAVVAVAGAAALLVWLFKDDDK